MLTRILLATAFVALCSCSDGPTSPAPAAESDSGATDSSETVADSGAETLDASRAHPVLDQSCPTSSATNACTKCGDEHCCESNTACDAECKALVTCIRTCTDGAAPCMEKCLTAHPKGAAAYSAANACVNLYCTTPCGGKADPCRDCRLDKCALEHVTCFADPECRRYGYCWEACTDAACDKDCRDKVTPAAVATYEKYYECLDTRCPSLCF